MDIRFLKDFWTLRHEARCYVATANVNAKELKEKVDQADRCQQLERDYYELAIAIDQHVADMRALKIETEELKKLYDVFLEITPDEPA